MEKSAEPKSRKLWHKLLTIRGVVAGTALATLVTWGVTELVTYLQHKVTAPDPVSWTVETNPNRVGGLSDLPINLTLPIGAHPSTGPGAGCINFRDWARNNGGVDAGATPLQVALQA